MNRKICIGMVLGILLVLPVTAATTIDIDAVEDSYVSNISADTNFGSGTWAKTSGYYGASLNYTYYKFPLSSIPARVTITDVDLEIYCNGTSPAVKDVFHVVNNQSWSEDLITWNKQPCHNSGQCNLTYSDRLNIAGSISKKSFDVTHGTKADYDASNANVSFMINGSGLTAYYATMDNPTSMFRPNLEVTFLYDDRPFYYNLVNSTLVEYNPNTAFAINVTWNLSAGAEGTISPVYIEANWSGSFINYTITNATWGPNVYNLTTTTIPAGHFRWRSLANSTASVWNYTDWVDVVIGKNTTNYMHTNITYGGTDYYDSNQSTTSDITVKIEGYSSFSNIGTLNLTVGSTLQSNPVTQTWGVGTHEIRVNTSGNENYSANTSGILRLLTITAAVVGGGGGGGGSPTFSIPSSACPDYYNAIPKTAFTGWAVPSERIQPPFTLQIFNGNTTQAFTATLESDDGVQRCTMIESPSGETLPNGIATFKFECIAPYRTVGGRIVFKTNTGCTDSREIVLNGGSGLFADLAAALLLFVNGDWLSAIFYPITLLGFWFPFIMLLIGILALFGIVVNIFRNYGGSS